MTDLKIKVLGATGENFLHTAQETVGFKKLTVSDTPTADTDCETVAHVAATFVPQTDLAGLRQIGTPTDASYAGGLLDLTPTTKISDATDQINGILAKLAPAKPGNLSSKTLALTTSYSAKEAGTNTSRSNVTDVARPQTSLFPANFYDGDAGVLTAEVDAVVEGTRTLTTANDAGTFGELVITDDSDFYASQVGKEGFWKGLNGRILPTADLALGSHTYQMKHSTTGDTNLLTFYRDNPSTVTIANDVATLPTGVSHNVSGVPTLNAAASISFAFDVVSAVGKFFHSTKVADVTGANVSTANVAPDGAGYAENATISLTGIAVTVNSSTYSEAPSVAIKGYNSKAVAGTTKNLALGARLDTVSNEAARKVSGSGQYPASGYGGTYDSDASLRSANTEELQMINGLFQRPAAVDYTGNLPVAGPDYSTGMGTNDRFVTFAPTTLSNASAFVLTIAGPAGTWSGNETTGVKIYAKVEGATGWIDCNAAYPSVGSPSADGAPALDLSYAGATQYVRRITFGSTPRSGQLYIRIGLPNGSDKKFSSISIA
jgi:hypothetical protein